MSELLTPPPALSHHVRTRFCKKLAYAAQRDSDKNKTPVICLEAKKHKGCLLPVTITALRDAGTGAHLAKRTLSFYDIHILSIIWSTGYSRKNECNKWFRSNKGKKLDAPVNASSLAAPFFRYVFPFVWLVRCYVICCREWYCLVDLEKAWVHENWELSYPSCLRYQREVDQTLWKLSTLIQEINESWN